MDYDPDVDPSTLNKRERKEYKKLQKKHEKDLARRERESKENKKSLIRYSIIAVVVIAAIVLVKANSEKKQELSQYAPELFMDNTFHDFGTISAADGKVETTFTIKNNGAGPLEVGNFVTSCMCTSAEVTIEGKTSPMFGMHNNIPWTGDIAPGETASLKIIYDPNFHANTRGEITRTIDFTTNDPVSKSMQVKIRTFVIP